MTAQPKLILGVTIGIVGYTLLYLGKGVQKYAIEGFKKENGLTLKSKHSRIWFLGTFFHVSYLFVHWGALLLAPINLIAPLEGLGLVILLFFSHRVLKEKISQFQTWGVFFIIAGTLIITLFNTNTGDIDYRDFNSALFLIVTTSLLSIEMIAILISKRNGYKAAGVIIGSTAGTFMALQTVAKRITAIPDPTITLIFSLLTFLTAFLTFVMTQFALVKAKANVVAPCFTSASTTLAVFIGILTLNERIRIVQILGIFSIVFGVIVINLFDRDFLKKSQSR